MKLLERGFSQSEPKIIFPCPDELYLLYGITLISSGSSDVISYMPFGLSPTEKPKYMHRHIHLQFLNPLDNLSDTDESQFIAWLIMRWEDLDEQ